MCERVRVIDKRERERGRGRERIAFTKISIPTW